MPTRTISASIRLDGERQFNKAMEDVNRNLRAMSAEVKASESAFLSQGKNMNTLRDHQQRLQAVYDKTKEKVQILREQLQDLADHQMKNSAEADRVRVSLARAEASMNSYEAAIRKTSGEIEELEKAEQDSADGMEELGDKTEQAGSKMGTMNVALGNLIANLAQRGVSLLKEIGQVGIEYNAQIESYTQAMTTALGSAEAAGKAIANIKLDAAVTPYSVDALVRANQLLIAAGESADGARKTIMALSDAVSATGGGNDELMRMAQNLQQIQNVGKASAMDIKQFQMAGIDVYGILADYTGQATEDVTNLTITYDLLAAALRNAASEGGRYFGANAAQAATLNGQISTLRDNVKSKLGEAFEGVSKTLSGELLPAVNEFVAGLDMKQVLEQFDRFVDIALAAGGAVAAIAAVQKIQAFINGWQTAAAAIRASEGALTAAALQQGVMNGQVGVGQLLYAALAGEIDLATTKQLALNAAQAMAPYALLAAGIAGIVVGLRALNLEAQDAAKAFTAEAMMSDDLDVVAAKLDETREKYRQMKAEFEDPWTESEYNYFDVQAMGAAVDELEAHYRQLEEAERAAAQAEAEHQAYLESTAGKIETVTGELEEMKAAYDKAYQNARESMLGQFDLFDQESTEDIIKALESQADYFNAYTGNLTTLQGMTADSIGLNADLVASLSDGSEKSVQAAATIAKGYEEALAQGDDVAAAYIENLNKAWKNQQKAADQAAKAMVQDQADAIEQMKLELHTLRQEQIAEARKAGLESAEGAAESFADSFDASAGAMEDAARSAGARVLSAFQDGLNSGTLTLPTIVYRGNGRIDGTHARGLDYVPYDGYIAELHKREMIVPAQAADEIRAGRFGSKNEINIYTQELSQSTMDYIYSSVVERAGDDI